MKAHHLVLGSAVGAFVFLAAENLPLIGEATGVQQAAAQQMGRQPWSFGPRNKSLAAQFQHLSRNDNNNSGNGGSGNTTVNQHVTTYNSSSTSIGNLTQIEQILSGDAKGSIDYLANQTSTGNQGSAASTDVTIDNSFANAQGDNTQASSGGGGQTTGGNADSNSSNAGNTSTAASSNASSN